MKKCKACGSQYDDIRTICPNCGSTAYFTICENCGEAFDTEFCPDCGVHKGDKGKTCPVCGKKYFSAACPDCGYAPNKAENVEPKKKSMVGTVLLWIFFLPIMASIAVWKKRDWNLMVKIALTCLIWGACLIVTYARGNSTTTSTTTSTSTATTTEEKVYYAGDELINKFMADCDKAGYPVTNVRLYNNTDYDHIRLGTINGVDVKMLNYYYSDGVGNYAFEAGIFGGTSPSEYDPMLKLFPIICKVLDKDVTDAQIKEITDDITYGVTFIDNRQISDNLTITFFSPKETYDGKMDPAELLIFAKTYKKK